MNTHENGSWKNNDEYRIDFWAGGRTPASLNIFPTGEVSKYASPRHTFFVFFFW